MVEFKVVQVAAIFQQFSVITFACEIAENNTLILLLLLLLYYHSTTCINTRTGSPVYQVLVYVYINV